MVRSRGHPKPGRPGGWSLTRSREIDAGGQSMWTAQSQELRPEPRGVVRLLPAYDNYMLGHLNRDFAVDPRNAREGPPRRRRDTPGCAGGWPGDGQLAHEAARRATDRHGRALLSGGSTNREKGRSRGSRRRALLEHGRRTRHRSGNIRSRRGRAFEEGGPRGGSPGANERLGQHVYLSFRVTLRSQSSL